MHDRERDGSTIVLAIREGGTLDRQLSALVKAVSRSNSDNSIVLTAINNLSRKVDTMSSNLDRIEKEAADAAENVGLVRAAVDGLNTVVGDLKAEIQTLKDQVAQGQLDQARLDAAAAVFEKADDDLDAIVVPPAPAEGGGATEPTEGGTPA